MARRIWTYVLYAEEIALIFSAIESEAKRRQGEDEDGNEAEKRTRKRGKEENGGEDECED